MEATVLCNAADFFYSLPQICASNNPISELCRQFILLGFCCDMLCQLRPHVDKGVPIQIMSSQFNLPQIEFTTNQGVKTFQR